MTTSLSTSDLLDLLRLKKYDSIISVLNVVGIGTLDDAQLLIVFEAALVHCSATFDPVLLQHIIPFICSRLRGISHHQQFRFVCLLLSYLSWGGLSFGCQKDSLKAVYDFSSALPSDLREIISTIILSYQHVLDNDITSYVNAMVKIAFLSQYFSSDDQFCRQIRSTYRRKTANYLLLCELARSSSTPTSTFLAQFGISQSSDIHSHFLDIDTDVLVSVDIEYFLIFSDRLQRLAHNNPGINFTVLLLLPTHLSGKSPIFPARLPSIPNVNLLCFRLDGNRKGNYFKTYSCCLKYLVLPELLRNHAATKGILMMDIDLSLDGIDLQQLLKKCAVDQLIYPNSVQTFMTSTSDYQSCISAGFLYASCSHSTFYEYVSAYIDHSFRLHLWEWGLDPAALVVGMSKFSLLPIKMPSLNDISPGSPIFEVESFEQSMKAVCRTG